MAQSSAEPGEILTAQSSMEQEQAERLATQKFLRQAIERFKLAAEAEQKNRREALDDLEFRAGKQWPADIETQRNLDGRPCLTINRLPPIIRQVTNEQRQQRPSIVVNPVGSGADIDTAEIIQGMIRHIEVQSDAEIAYDTAFEQMVTMGFGYWRILTQYVDSDDPQDFNKQEIKIKRIKNPFTVYYDPAAIEPDYSDARYCFIVEDVPISEYKDNYSNSAAASLQDFTSVGDQAPDWATKDTIRVAEYFYIEESQKTLHKMADGTVTEEPQEGLEIIDSRKKLDRRVKWAKINAIEILDEQEIPGHWIPVVPNLADDLDINGKRHVAGLVRDAKDPQRMYNYWNSSATETIALAPRAPFVGAEGQFENHEGQWQAANQRNFSYLEYKPVSVGGSPAPPPARQVYEPPIQSMALMIRQSDNDLKATTGIYDASLGQQGPDQSGKAILARQKQGDVATLHFVDNLSRAMRFTGRILVDWIPKIYDSPRIQRIINPDQSVDHVVVHNGAGDAATMLMNQKVKKVYDLGVGRYDVTVSVGPSYQSKRQEAQAMMLAFMQSVPSAAPLIADLVARNSDIPGGTEIADRLKKMLPPQLQDNDDSTPEAQLQRAQGQLQQLSQQHQQLVTALQHAENIINTKQVESSAKFNIAKLEQETKLAIAEITTKAQVATERSQLYMDIWKEMHGAAHDVALQAGQQSHEQDMQGQQLDAQSQMAQQAQSQNGNGATGQAQ